MSLSKSQGHGTSAEDLQYRKEIRKNLSTEGPSMILCGLAAWCIIPAVCLIKAGITQFQSLQEDSAHEKSFPVTPHSVATVSVCEGEFTWCTWRLEVSLEYCSAGTMQHVFWDRISHFYMELTNSAGGLVSEPRDPPDLPSQCLGYKWSNMPSFFCGCWGLSPGSHTYLESILPTEHCPFKRQCF